MNKDMQDIIFDKINLLEQYKTSHEQPLKELIMKINLKDIKVAECELEIEVINELISRLKEIDSSFLKDLYNDKIRLGNDLNILIDERLSLKQAFEVKQKENLETINIIDDYINELKKALPV